MTLREYLLAVDGSEKKRSHEFEHTRAIVYTLAAINRNPNSSFPTIEKFWPLPTDDLEGIAQRDEEAGNKLQEKLNEFKKKYLHGRRGA